MKENAAKRKQQFKDFDTNITYSVDREREIQLILAAGNKHYLSIIVDLDRTLLSYREGSRKHRSPLFRPHFRTFVNKLKNKANLFIFSSGLATRSKNIFKKYHQPDFKGYFIPGHLYRGKKCFNQFETEKLRILIVDDSDYAIHERSKKLHVHVDRWFGDSKDTGLLKALKEINKLYDELSENQIKTT